MSRPPNTPAPQPERPITTVECRRCQYYQVGEIASSAGRVRIRVCTHPHSESHMEIVGALHSCEKFSPSRNGVNHG